jgi:hypothetical protein
VEGEVRALCANFPVPGHSLLIGDELQLPVETPEDALGPVPSPA